MVYTAKALGFGLAYYAKKRGASEKDLLRFKISEIITLILAELVVTYYITQGII